jgi:hypothetical protein
VAHARPSEIDYLNGEIVRLGKEMNVATPLNAVVVMLLRRVETDGRYLTAHEIERALRRGLPDRPRRQLRLRDLFRER